MTNDIFKTIRFSLFIFLFSRDYYRQGKSVFFHLRHSQTTKREKNRIKFGTFNVIHLAFKRKHGQDFKNPENVYLLTVRQVLFNKICDMNWKKNCILI